MDKGSELSFEYRIGLAYNRLTNWEWDELLGPKPDGFDEMPRISKRRLFRRRAPSKFDYISAAMEVLREVCPMADYYANQFRVPPDERTKVEWLELHGQLRLFSLLVKRGVRK